MPRHLLFSSAFAKLFLACAFGTVFLAGAHFGDGRRLDSALWLALGAAQVGVAYYIDRRGRRR